MDIHPEDVIISIINITVLFVLLRLILWKHVIRYLAERSERIGKQFLDAENKEEQAAALLVQYDDRMRALKTRDHDLLLAAREKAEKEASSILSKAQDDAALLILDAEHKIALEKTQALEDAHEEVTKLAADMASKILHREVSSFDNENVVADFFK